MAGREMDWSEDASSAFDVVSGEFVVVTPEGADCEALERLSALLRRVRSAFAVDAVFVCEWAGGEPVLRWQREAGPDANALQALYGAQLLAAPASKPSLLRFDTLPVVGDGGIGYGTLCCRRVVPEQGNDDSPLQALQSVARLIAEWFDDAATGVAA